MRSTRLLAFTLLVTLGAVGCGGPELIVKPLNGEDQAKVYFKPLQDGEGGDVSKGARESDIGDMPTDWELPPELLGGKGQARVVYADGTERLVEFFEIQKKKDTIIRVTKPQPTPKSR